MLTRPCECGKIMATQDDGDTYFCHHCCRLYSKQIDFKWAKETPMSDAERKVLKLLGLSIQRYTKMSQVRTYAMSTYDLSYKQAKKIKLVS